MGPDRAPPRRLSAAARERVARPGDTAAFTPVGLRGGSRASTSSSTGTERAAQPSSTRSRGSPRRACSGKLFEASGGPVRSSCSDRLGAPGRWERHAARAGVPALMARRGPTFRRRGPCSRACPAAGNREARLDLLRQPPPRGPCPVEELKKGGGGETDSPFCPVELVLAREGKYSAAREIGGTRTRRARNVEGDGAASAQAGSGLADGHGPRRQGVPPRNRPAGRRGRATALPRRPAFPEEATLGGQPASSARRRSRVGRGDSQPGRRQPAGAPATPRRDVGFAPTAEGGRARRRPSSDPCSSTSSTSTWWSRSATDVISRRRARGRADPARTRGEHGRLLCGPVRLHAPRRGSRRSRRSAPWPGGSRPQWATEVGRRARAAWSRRIGDRRHARVRRKAGRAGGGPALPLVGRGPRPRARTSHPLATRGIALGPAVPRGGDWYGRAVNLASRIAGDLVARGGVHLRRRRTRRRGGGHFRWVARRGAPA